MNNEKQHIPFVNHIMVSEKENFQYNEQDIIEEYKQTEANKSTLAIKLLSIFGGFLGMCTFIGFLAIARLFENELVVAILGIVLIFGSLVLNKIYNKLIIDTVTVSSFFIGFVMFGVGLQMQDFDKNATAISVLVVGLLSFAFTRSNILSFLSILIVSGSILTLIIMNDLFDFIHLYMIGFSFLLAYVMLNEAHLISTSKVISKLYNSLRIGLIFALLFGLGSIAKKGMLSISYDFIWVSSIAFIAIILYLVYKIIEVLEITKTSTKTITYVLSIIVLLSVALSPSILGAITIILLCYYVNYKLGFAIGIIALTYFIGQYYYDINFTLLTKSMILFFSGVAFLVLYLFTSKNLSDEKI